MGRKWTKEEEKALVAALDTPVAQGVTSSARAAEFVMQIFESNSADKQSPFTKKQIVDKIHYMSRGVRCTIVAELFRNWSEYRDRLLAKQEEEGRSGDGSLQADGDSASARTLRLKWKRDSEAKTTSSSSHNSLNEEDEYGLERSSDGLSTAGSDEYTDVDLEVIESKKSKAPRNPILPTSMDLDPAEQSLINCVRGFIGHDHWEDNPSTPDVDRALDKVLGKLSLAIKCFRKAVPTAGLNTLQLTPDAAELSSRLFSPAVSGTDLGRFLTVLFTNPAITVDLALQIYAAAAIYDWVFQRFEGEVDRQVKVVYHTLSQYAPDFAKKLALCDKLHHLETNVKPSLPRLAEELQIKLLKIFLGLRVAPQAGSTTVHITTDEQATLLAQWQIKANQAFEQALDLRLQMEQSVCPYSFRWVMLGQGFDKSWMESAHDSESPAQGARVLVTLRPAIYSRARRDGAEPLLVVSALVMLEGHGAPSEQKIDFGAIR